ncbi:MAG: hypothetical protein PHF00_13005, partial [Elusimicrobia bacterium]|nr:hypothetical protein [Elusimicrobiota bacterium]
MKYWVYKDSQIMGPLAKEELGPAAGLCPETLVCLGESAGTAETDWRCAGDVEELNELCASRATAAVGAALDTGDGVLGRWQRAGLALPAEDGDELLAAIFSPGIPDSVLPRPDEIARQELLIVQARVQELTEELNALRGRLAEKDKEEKEKEEERERRERERDDREKENQARRRLEASRTVARPGPPAAAAQPEIRQVPPAAAPVPAREASVVEPIPPAVPAPAPRAATPAPAAEDSGAAPLPEAPAGQPAAAAADRPADAVTDSPGDIAPPPPSSRRIVRLAAPKT